jgi:hypothetical protein
MAGNPTGGSRHRLRGAFLSRWKAERLRMLVLLLAVIASVCFAVAAGVYLVSADSGADRRDALPYFAITLATLLVGVASKWEMAGRSSKASRSGNEPTA